MMRKRRKLEEKWKDDYCYGEVVILEMHQHEHEESGVYRWRVEELWSGGREETGHFLLVWRPRRRWLKSAKMKDGTTVRNLGAEKTNKYEWSFVPTHRWIICFIIVSETLKFFKHRLQSQQVGDIQKVLDAICIIPMTGCKEFCEKCWNRLNLFLRICVHNARCPAKWEKSSSHVAVRSNRKWTWPHDIISWKGGSIVKVTGCI